MDKADADPDLGAAAPEPAPPSLVFLSPFTPITAPSSRRLSSHFTEPSRPVTSSRKKLAYVSLQGRLINAEEATSAREIRGGLSRDEIVAWELFSPIQRVTTVAVIGAATAESRKNRIISQLKKSVEVRDQLLSSMQQKLDTLCEQVNNVGNHPINEEVSPEKSAGFPFDSTPESDLIKFIDCGCWLCDQHQKQLNVFVGDSETRMSGGCDMLRCQKASSMEEEAQAEQEERRMSDLSDWASSSVTSSVEIPMNGLCIEEQDIDNLKKECEEKDAMIRELTKFLHSSDAAASKRISELEDIIRRKKVIITKLKKDMLVLEQKIVQLTRLRRPSSSSASAHKEGYTIQNPFMAENILYDMDSTTSHSSSDSDCSPPGRPQTRAAPRVQGNQTDRANPSTTGPLREISLNLKPNKIPSSGRQKQQQLSSGGGDSKMCWRQPNAAAGPKDTTTSRRRWS